MTSTSIRQPPFGARFARRKSICATDVRGNALGNDGNPVNDMKNPGSIIVHLRRQAIISGMNGTESDGETFGEGFPLVFSLLWHPAIGKEW
ncbi:MAG: hypothetical protein ACLRWP_12990 [Bilophila wadsworthia]